MEISSDANLLEILVRRTSQVRKEVRGMGPVTPGGQQADSDNAIDKFES